METFKIKTYGRTELALLYSTERPAQGAWRKLLRWINHHPTLGTRLAATGLPSHSRVFTPATVRPIVESLGASSDN